VWRRYNRLVPACGGVETGRPALGKAPFRIPTRKSQDASDRPSDMDRRAFIVAAAAVVAGCSGGGSGTDEPTDTDPGGEATPTPTPTASPTPTATPTPDPAALAVTEVSTPSTIEIGTTFTVSVTVENSGGQSGTFSAPVEARLGTGDWTTTDATAETAVPAGETATAEVELGPYHYVQPASFRVPDAEAVARPRFVPRQLPLGGSHLLPNGVEIAVESFEFADLYTYEGDGGTKQLEPTDSEKWAIATVRAENTGDEPADAPLVSDIAIFRGEEEYAYQAISDNRSRYGGGELEPGGVSSGDLPSDVPAAAAREDLHVEYKEAYDGGQVSVFWSLSE